MENRLYNFHRSPDMYYDFKSSMEKTEYTKTNATIIFDDACHSVYIIWGESIDGETFAI